MDGISKPIRVFFLECALWFLVNYKILQDKCKDKKQLNQKKKATNAHVRFYTDSLLKEFSNMTYCNIQLLKKQKEFSFDRNSSSPLEHMFGITRGRIKDAQTCSKFVKSIAEFQLFEKEYDNIKIEQRIPGKKNPLEFLFLAKKATMD